VAKEIVIGWDEWLASRAAKRENLRRLGLDAPSRRTTDYGTSGHRLRKAFGGERAPRFDITGSAADDADCTDVR